MHQSKLWYHSIEEGILQLLHKLNRPETNFEFNPVLLGNTKSGNKIKLGPSIYALKILKILNNKEFLNNNTILEWGDFINSFQKQNSKFPKNSFIDEDYLTDISKFNLQNDFKNLIKKIILSFNEKVPFEENEKKIVKSVKAETKQAISILHEFNIKNKYLYIDFPRQDSSINNYLDSYNWQYPWNSGAQFAGQCLFISTQLSEDERLQCKKVLSSYIKNKVNKETGFYYEGSLPQSAQLVNGAMKVLTGLQWIDEEIHYPKKIIDYSLNYVPNKEGCDLIDVVHVLSMCGKQSGYKKNQIIKYFDNILNMVREHYQPKTGGFSYFINKSQTHYYGLKISDGRDTSDLHGTLLCLWAISIILDFKEDSSQSWNILKP